MTRKMMSITFLAIWLVLLMMGFSPTVHSRDRPGMQRPPPISSEPASAVIPRQRSLKTQAQDRSGGHLSRREPNRFNQSLHITTTHSITHPLDIPRDSRPQLEVEPATILSVKARLPLTSPLLLETPLVERHHDVQPIRREFKALSGQVIDEAYAITRLAPTYTSSSANVRAATECVVASTADSGSGTLRQCLENAVAGDTITFDPAVFPPASPATIPLSNALPWITTDNLTIDASDAGVILDGSGLSLGPGLLINGASGVQIRGLQIVSFPWDGIALIGGASNNIVEGNFIGTNASGTAALGNLSSGIFIGHGASHNIIGGTTPSAGNLISGNEASGVWLQDSGTTSNQIQGNLIGTDISGTRTLGNLRAGVFIGFKASNNIVGGETPGAGNLISGNEDDGIHIQNPGTTGNQIQGNFIGTDVYGTAAIGNLQMGIFIGFGASNNIVGGSTSGARNLISGNEFDGIRLQNVGTTGNQIQGNFIGTDTSGTASLGNLQIGISILDASDNIIGGNIFTGSGSLGQGNLISGNQNDGIRLQDAGATGNQIQGNFIGTDISGTVACDNLGDGIVISFDASDNLIGGDTSGAGNLISGNKDQGIHIQNPGTTDNRIQGNFIGTDVSGTVALGNLADGIAIGFGASNNLIGGDRFTGSGPLGQGNLISGNGDHGIQIQNEGTDGNQIQGNFIGTNLSGTAILSNNHHGIVILNGGSNNLIGGEVPGQVNLISGNRTGIVFQYAGTSSNQVESNSIGTDVSGTMALGNLEYGIALLGGASDNRVGGATITAGNTIAFHNRDGVLVDGHQTRYNTISHNSIYNNGGLGIETINGGNAELAPPTITTVISTSVSGQAQPGHIVEVFSDNDNEGRFFEGSVMADGSGVFTLTYSGVFSGLNLTATATDAAGNTSEFSTRFPVPINPQKRIFLPIVIKSSS